MAYTRMVTDEGNQIIQVKSLFQTPSGWNGTYAFVWCGELDLQVGDQFILNIGGRDWEVEVHAIGSSYEGEMRRIGGKYGLKYNLSLM